MSAVVGAGFLKLNPAIVEIRITELDAGHCRAIVAGAAKEGVIKQHAGEGAVRRVLEATNLYAPTSLVG